MTEEQASKDLEKRGVWRIAPGLWCDKSVPDMIAVAPECDNAVAVRSALQSAGTLPEIANRS